MDEGAELRALDPSRRDEHRSVLLACLVQRNDVGVVERGYRPGLSAQALPDHRVACDCGLDQLQRHGPVEPQLAGTVEDPDPAEADDALDLVSAEDGAGREHVP